MKPIKYLKQASLVLAVTFAISSCNSCSHKPQTETAVKVTKVVYDSLVVNEKTPLIDGQSTPLNELTIHFTFPKNVNNDSVLLKIVQKVYNSAMFGNEYANLTPKQAIDNFKKKYEADYRKTTIEDYNQAKKAGYKMDDWGNTYQIMKVDTLQSRPETLSFSTFVENYNGGAHGSHHTGYYNIDLKTGKLLNESDIFKAGYEKELNKIIVAQLLEDNKVTKEEEMTEKGFFNLKELKSNKNFLLTKDGVQYGFNEYEIAPYYMGLIKVSIPNEKLASILKK